MKIPVFIRLLLFRHYRALLRLMVVFYLVFIGMYCNAQIAKRPSAEEEYTRRSILKLNVLSPIMGAITVHYEIQHTANTSSQLEFFYFTGRYFGQITEYKGGGFTYDYRYYMKGACPKGAYVQPYGRIQKYDYVGTQNPTVSGGTPPFEKVMSYGIGMVLGYQTIFKRHFTFEFYGGPFYSIGYGDGVRLTGQDFGPPISGGWLRLGTTFGYAF